MASIFTLIVAVIILTIIDYFIIYGYSWKSVNFSVFLNFFVLLAMREKKLKKLSKKYGEYNCETEKRKDLEGDKWSAKYLICQENETVCPLLFSFFKV